MVAIVSLFMVDPFLIAERLQILPMKALPAQYFPD